MFKSVMRSWAHKVWEPLTKAVLTSSDWQVPGVHGWEDMPLSRWPTDQSTINRSTESIQSIKIPPAFFAETDELILKFLWKCRRPTKQSWKEQSWKMEPSWFQNSLQSYRNQKCGDGQKTDQWSRTENPDINPHTQGQLFSKGYQDHSMQKNTLFNKWCLNNWISTCRMELDT